MAATMFAANTLAAKPAVASRAGRRGLKVQAAAYNGAYAEELVATAVRRAPGGEPYPYPSTRCRSTEGA